MAFTIGSDGASFDTCAEALAALPAGQQVWMDGSELTRTEAEYIAAQEAAAPDPEDEP